MNHLKNIVMKAALWCCIAAAANGAWAQDEAQQLVNVEFTEEAFPNDPKGLKEILKVLRDGVKAYEKGDYQTATPLLVQANQYNPDNADVNFMLADIYKKAGQTSTAIALFEKAALLAESVNDINTMVKAFLQLGIYAHSQEDFDAAIEYFEWLKSVYAEQPLSQFYLMVTKKLDESTTAKALKANPVRCFIDNLGSVVNTQYHEYSPVITADASTIYYTACRPDGVGGEKARDASGKYNEDIWLTERDMGIWTTPQNVGPPLNTKANDAVVGISGDGSILYCFMTDGGGDIAIAKLNGTQWGKKESMGKAINTDYHETGGSLSSDGKTFYFVSDRETPGPNRGTPGNHDIYYSKLGDDGKWQPAINIGYPINTPYDEVTPFIHPNGTTLYFSSNGPNSMGGYDIFKSEFVNGAWSQPENIGYPVNTIGDDRFFTISASDRHGFFSSQREGGYGLFDLYQITFLGTEKPPIYMAEDRLMAYLEKSQNVISLEKRAKSSVAVTLLKGVVTDAETQTPLLASIEITDNELGASVATFTTNSASGKYLVSLPSGKNYGVAVKADGYLFYSENIDISKVEEAEYQEIVKDIPLNKIKVGVKVVLRNIFFETGKSTLTDQSITELERLVTLLKETEKLRIEVSGHTDNTGSVQLNKKLSEARAKAVVDYLVKHGIDAKRLTYAGYGPDQPIESNDTPEGKASNRRVEFKILGN
jgi:outer membrane protein OmpA-like peptidoglycan-associated protein/tetratricopeptide (TPR) repeat protein